MPALLTYTDKSGPVSIACDLLTAFSDVRAAEIPRAPVEQGADLTDHVIELPREIEIEILQTETPVDESDDFSPAALTVPIRASLYSPGGLLAVTDAAAGVLGLADSPETEITLSRVLQSGGPLSRGADLLEAIETARRARALCTLIAPLTKYDGDTVQISDLLIESVTHAKAQGDPTQTILTVKLTQIRKIATARAQVKAPVDERMKAGSKKGKPPEKRLSDEEKKAQQKSFAASLLDGGKALLP